MNNFHESLHTIKCTIVLWLLVVIFAGLSCHQRPSDNNGAILHAHIHPNVMFRWHVVVYSHIFFLYIYFAASHNCIRWRQRAFMNDGKQNKTPLAKTNECDQDRKRHLSTDQFFKIRSTILCCNEHKRQTRLRRAWYRRLAALHRNTIECVCEHCIGVTFAICTNLFAHNEHAWNMNIYWWIFGRGMCICCIWKYIAIIDQTPKSEIDTRRSLFVMFWSTAVRNAGQMSITIYWRWGNWRPSLITSHHWWLISMIVWKHRSLRHYYSPSVSGSKNSGDATAKE